MNSKIIEIARQANVLRTEYASPKYGVHSEPALADLMNLTELVLAECFNVCDDLRGYSGVGTDGDPYDTPSWNAALIAVKQVIQQRFGIGEYNGRSF